MLTVIIVCVTEEDGGEMYQFVPRFDFTILILHNSATYYYTESATIRLVLRLKLFAIAYLYHRVNRHTLACLQPVYSVPL